MFFVHYSLMLEIICEIYSHVENVASNKLDNGIITPFALKPACSQDSKIHIIFVETYINLKSLKLYRTDLDLLYLIIMSLI